MKLLTSFIEGQFFQIASFDKRRGEIDFLLYATNVVGVGLVVVVLIAIVEVDVPGVVGVVLSR